MKNCGWCQQPKRFRAQVCGAKFPIVCRDCGSKVGDLGWEEINHIIVERDYYKKEFYKKTLTKKKK